MTSFNWTCPFCDRDTTITDERSSLEDHRFFLSSKHGPQYLRTFVIACPNEECKELVITAQMGAYSSNPYGSIDTPPHTKWQLRPSSRSRVFPSYVPKAVLDDYEEACAIRDASPKASATLARRCLQGMIRDFWNVKKDTLFDEVKTLKGTLDSTTWDAIDAVRKIGNIGAHMEKDVNVIVDVEPEEAELLIGLIETLILEWYVARNDREQRMAGIVAVAKQKQAAKDAGKKVP